MVNSTGTNDSNTDLSQRTRLLEERLVDPRSPICVDSLLDGIVALIYDSEGLKKTKNFDGFFSRFHASTREIREKRIQLNDFQTIKILGRGAFGTVDLVRRKQTGQVYAMKSLSKFEMLKKSDTAFFWEERNIMAFSNSEWIVKLHYAFQDAKNLYMIMDYMPGGDLITLISRYEIDENAAKFYCAEIVLALDAVHSMGYVHRDVKPDNLLLDSRGHLKLADFGTCIKMDERGQVRSDTAIGTPDYISPEILKSQSNIAVYGPEVDWWSLGVVFYEMLYGETPFYEESLVGTYNKIMNHHNHLTFPADPPISAGAQQLIRDLLTDQSARLGKTGMNEIKRHPYFMIQTEWTWETIRRVLPPVVPKVSQDDDTSNFEEIEPEDRPSEESFTTSKSFAGNQLSFIGFSYSNEQQPFLDRRWTGKFSNATTNVEENERTKNDLEKRLRRLQEELNDKCRDEQMFKSKLYELERKIVVLSTELKETHSKYEIESEHRLKLENQLSEIHQSSNEENRESTEKIAQLEREIGDLKRDLHLQLETNHQLKMQSVQYERTHEEFHDKYEEMFHLKTKLEKDLEHHQYLLEQERQTKHTTFDKLQQLQDDYQRLSHDYSKLKSHDAFHRQELINLEETISTFEQERLTLQNQIDSLRSRLLNNGGNAKHSDVKEIFSKIESEGDALKKVHDELISSQKHCRALEIDLKEMTSNYDQLNEQFQEQTRIEEERRMESEQKIRQIEEQLQLSRFREEQLQSDFNRKQNDHDELKNQQKINQEKLQIFQIKCDEYEQQLKVSKESLEQSEKQINAMKNQIKQLTEKFHQEKTTLQEQYAQLEKEKQSMIIEAEAVHRDFQVRLGLLDSQINTVRDQYEKAKYDLEQVNIDRRNLEKEYHDLLDKSYEFQRQINELQKKYDSERANKEAVLKKLQEVITNPSQKMFFSSRSGTFRSRQHERDRSERNLVRRLEQTLEQERTKYRNLQNEKEELVAQLTDEINQLKHQLKEKETEEKVARPIQRVPSTSRLEGWVQIPTRNLRKGGWKYQYAMVKKTKFLLYNSDKKDQVNISIDFEQFYHVRSVTQGDVLRVDPNLLPRIFQILYDSQSQPSLSQSSASLPRQSSLSYQEPDRPTIEYKGHAFLLVTYRKPSECEVCHRPCHSLFSPPACLECTRCHFRCHKQHYDDRDDSISSCRVFDDVTGKYLLIMCGDEQEQKQWIAFLQTKVQRRATMPRSPQSPPADSGRIHESIISEF